MEKYNGWTNYATWRINLEVFDGMEFDHYPSDAELQDYVEELFEYQSSGLALDYARAFISDVNWSEIASNLYYREAKEA
jgi:hypothetical protein